MVFHSARDGKGLVARRIHTFIPSVATGRLFNIAHVSAHKWLTSRQSVSCGLLSRAQIPAKSVKSPYRNEAFAIPQWLSLTAVRVV
jgi:hypothetical protein